MAPLGFTSRGIITTWIARYASDMTTLVGQVSNLPRKWQVRNLPHMKDGIVAAPSMCVETPPATAPRSPTGCRAWDGETASERHGEPAAAAAFRLPFPPATASGPIDGCSRGRCKVCRPAPDSQRWRDGCGFDASAPFVAGRGKK